MLLWSAALASEIFSGSSGVGGAGSKQKVFHSFSLDFVVWGAARQEDFFSAVTRRCSCVAEPFEPPTLLLPLELRAPLTDTPCPTPKGAGISGIVVLMSLPHKPTLFLCPVSKLIALNTVLGYPGKQIFLLHDVDLCT